MEDNKEHPQPANDEELHEQLNTPSADETIVSSAEQPQTINNKPETEEMEVHHHAHDPIAPHHKKNWKSYFWEFLMLFLAVFCGFLAEYQLEHVIENNKEKQYIASLVRDVELDIASLKEAMQVRKQYINYYDSLVLLLNKREKRDMNDIYFYARFVGRTTEFKYHDRTIQQLKNSGNMRLVRNKNAADSITIYDNESIKMILNQQEIEPRFRNDILSYHIGKIFDANVWNEMVNNAAFISRPNGNPDLITSDPKLINDFTIQVITLKTAYRITNSYIVTALQSAENLAAYLKKEYHLN